MDSPDHPAVAELVHYPDDCRLSQYRAAYNALAYIVDPPGHRSLLRSVVPAATIYRSVVWLPDALIPHYPAIEQLPALARAIHHIEPQPIPLRGFSSHRALQVLRLTEDDQPEDKPLRALTLALATRRHHNLSDSGHAILQKCLDALAQGINGLYHERTTTDGQRKPNSPLFALLQECAHHETLDGYLTHLRVLLLAQPQAHKLLTARLRHDIPEFLGVSIDQTFVERGPTGTPKKKKSTARPPPDLPPDEPDPDSRTVRISPAISAVEVDPRAPEPPDELESPLHLSPTTSAIRNPPTIWSLLREARSIRNPQKIRHSNEQLLTFHVDVLTTAETKLLAPAITTQGLEAAQDGDLELSIQLAIAGLILSLGYEPTRAAALLTAPKAQNDRPYLSDDRTHVVSPALAPESDFRADDAQNLAFEPTSVNIRIPLPPPLASLLQRIEIGPSMEPAVRRLRNGVSKAVAAICTKLELGSVTRGRLRRTCSAQLYEHSRDLAAVMHLTRDTFGQSMAPIYYCSFQESYLQKVYRGAIWPLWGVEPPDSAASDSEHRIGSQALLRPESANRIAHSIGAALQAPTPPEPSCPDLSKIHNALMSHLVGMMLSVVGHRPANALFELRLHDFDLELNAAVIEDKRIDIAHMVRLVALGSRVSAQIKAYLSHLEQLSDCETLPVESRKRISDALTSRYPLLFQLSDSGAPLRMSIDQWRRNLPAAWQDIPDNWGRHYIASVGRELEVSPELLHIQLGHYESVVYPFSPDSPSNPLDFVELMNPALDKLFAHEGWSCRRQPKGNLRWQDSWDTLGPLHRWQRQQSEHARMIREQRRKFRRYYLATQYSIRQRAEDLVLSVVANFDARLTSLIGHRIDELRHRRSALPTRNAETTGMSLEAAFPEQVLIETQIILGVQEDLDKEAKKNPALQIASQNVLARCLRWAAQKDIYVGFLPGYWIYRAPADPTPFMPSHMQAVRQIRLLREACTAAFRDSEFQSDSEFRLGTILLCLVVHGNIDRYSSLMLLLHPETQVLSTPALADCITASRPEHQQSIGLRQRAAIAYAVWHRDFRQDGLPARAQLETALKRVIPSKAMPASKLLESLLATMQVANQIERSGLVNLALDPDKGCVGLPHERHCELFGQEYDRPQPKDPVTIEPITRQPERSQIKEEYQAIKRIWPNKQHDIHLPLTGQVVELTKRNNPARKKRVHAELVAMSQNREWSTLGRQLAGWLDWEFIERRPNAESFRKYGGLYSGFLEVAMRLVARCGPRLEKLETDELELLYTEIIEDSASTNAGRIALHLKRWHKYLVLFYSADQIETSALRRVARGEVAAQGKVDNALMLPQEVHGITEVLTRNCQPVADSRIGAQTDYRILHQSQLLYCLLIRSGLRIREAFNLRYRDVIRVENHIYLIVRKTGYLDAKTTYARRLVNYSATASTSECDLFRTWIRAEQAIGRLKQPGDFIFTDLAGKPTDVDLVDRILKSVPDYVCFSAIEKAGCYRRIHLKNSELRHGQEYSPIPERHELARIP